MTTFSEKRRKLLRMICQGLGATSAFGMFQACSTKPAYGPPPVPAPAYGPPPVSEYEAYRGAGNDVQIHGTVFSESAKEPIPGIKVSVKGLFSTAYTDDDGIFSIYVPEQDLYKLKFEDADGFFPLQKKKITLAETGVPLEIYLIDKNVTDEDDEE